MSKPTPAPGQLRRGSSTETIARHIRTDIEAGRLRDGEQLPSTKQLAAEWGTSTATISRAMQQLAEEGVVINRDRSSRLVNYPRTAPAHAEQAGVGVSTSSPQVVLVGGYAGSGKTELGRILARATRWALLDKDTTTRPVVEAALEECGKSPHDRESPTYLRLIRPAEYESLMAAVTENVDLGVSVIATAPFWSELSSQAWCDRVAAEMESLGARLHVLWIRCDAETMRTYIKRRGAARDASKLANWNKYVTNIDLEFHPAIEHHIIDNSADQRPLREQAEEFLQEVTRR